MVERKDMNSNVDVLKELEVKNKEIYINKLGIDLDTNLENLLITIDNMMSLFTTEVTEKVLEIKNDALSSEQTKERIIAFQKLICDEIIKLINERTLSLKDKVQDIDNIDYKEVLNNETMLFLQRIGEYYNLNVDALIEEVSTDTVEFDKNRISDYLKILYYEKLITKLKEAIVNMDIILYNNYEEGYQRFLNLNAKTLK